MKKLILLLLPCALLIGQQATKEKKAAPKPAPAATESAQKIPDGAKELEPYLYSYTDADGKKWLYRQTPFGVVKWEDKPAAAPIIDNTNPVVITDLGDSVRFQWKTPFGEQKWVRKKTELTDEEKAMIKREQTKRPAPDPMTADKPTDAAAKPVTSGGIKPCASGDTSAPGTVVDGRKKIISPTPFGEVCRWEPVSQ